MTYDLYDFDKTVYPYDSETVFIFYCLLRRPYLLLMGPWLLLNLLLFFLGCGDSFKGRCFSFLRFVDGERMAKDFWAREAKRIYPFFRPERRARPAVVCSASPEFFLRPICEQYAVAHLVATRMDPKTGRILGRNCKDVQKPLRLAQALPGARFINVFSDDLPSDLPIFELGTHCFYARKGTLTALPLAEVRRRAAKKKP